MTRVVSFAGLPVQAWSNGAGQTVELARHPAARPGEGGAFEWRLSIATVSDDSEFSHLPGVDRVLVPLSPGGLTLWFDGVARRLDRYEPVTFTGEQTVRPSPPQAPTTDLNLMVRRGSGTPAIEIVWLQGRHRLPADALAVIVLDGSVTWNESALDYGDTLLGPSAGETLVGQGVLAVASR